MSAERFHISNRIAIPGKKEIQQNRELWLKIKNHSRMDELADDLSRKYQYQNWVLTFVQYILVGRKQNKIKKLKKPLQYMRNHRVTAILALSVRIRRPTGVAGANGGWLHWTLSPSTHRSSVTVTCAKQVPIQATGFFTQITHTNIHVCENTKGLVG